MTGLLLVVLLQGPPLYDTVPPIAPKAWEPLSFPSALMWGVVPKAWDLYWTAECLDKNPHCREANGIQPTVEHRAALALAASVIAAEGFYYMESERGMRLWPFKTRLRSRVPRYVWAGLNTGLGFWNLRNSRKK